MALSLKWHPFPDNLPVIDEAPAVVVCFLRSATGILE
jgi:hypothetical protein